jgi:hypothetical protein
MSRIAFTAGVVFLAASAVIAQAQEQSASALSIPVAVHFQSECTGFIAESPVPRDLFVLGGADDDSHSVVRQFVEGDSIFISAHGSGNVAVGSEYRVVRPAKELFQTQRYQGQFWTLRKLGKPYEDVAVVRVTHTNPEGAVARVTFSCGTIFAGDTLVPFQPRTIPQYTVSARLDPFMPLDNNKQHGRIVASRNNQGFLGAQTVVYLNLGGGEGAQPGKRYRIYKVLPSHPIGTLTSLPTPPETIGEAVVLSVQSKSCVAMVVASYREVSTGDFVEAE